MKRKVTAVVVTSQLGLHRLPTFCLLVSPSSSLALHQQQHSINAAHYHYYHHHHLHQMQFMN